MSDLFLPFSPNPESNSYVGGGSTYTVPSGKFAEVTILNPAGEIQFNAADTLTFSGQDIYFGLTASSSGPTSQQSVFQKPGTITVTSMTSTGNGTTKRRYLAVNSDEVINWDTVPSSLPVSYKVGHKTRVVVENSADTTNIQIFGWFSPDGTAPSKFWLAEGESFQLVDSTASAVVAVYPVINQA